jgi:hypothetical protein
MRASVTDAFLKAYGALARIFTVEPARTMDFAAKVNSVRFEQGEHLSKSCGAAVVSPSGTHVDQAITAVGLRAAHQDGVCVARDRHMRMSGASGLATVGFRCGSSGGSADPARDDTRHRHDFASLC